VSARVSQAQRVTAVESALTPLHYAMLGLLRDQPAHGYQLQHAFGVGGDLNAIVPVEQPTLYAALKELARRRLIEGREAREGLRPPKVVYALTADGRRALIEWLREPVARMRQVRLDFLLKVYFNRARGKQRVRALVEAQIGACNRYLADLQAGAAALDRESFAYLVSESRASAARSTLAWLNEYRASL